MKKIKKFFKFDEHNANMKTEILAGVSTFLAMVYILPTNAGMLSATGMPYGGVFLATALAAIIATLIMGLYARFPLALAPGMGVNAFFTFTVVMTMGIPWGEALSATLIGGIIFLIISATSLRKKIIDGIPVTIKIAVGAGIGFFVTFLGLQNAGIVVSDPSTVVALGDLGNHGVLLTLFGLALVLILHIRGHKFAIIISMVVTMIVGLIMAQIVGTDSGLPVLGKIDFSKSFAELGDIKEVFGKGVTQLPNLLSNNLKGAFLAVLTFVFIDFFDTAGTLSAVGVSAGLMDEETGEIKEGGKALLADSVGTVAGAVLGTSTTTTFIESQVGIEQGGRTGLTAVVVAILFGVAILLYPFISVFNSQVTAIALIMVGSLMAKQLKFIDWSDEINSITAFFIIVFMVLTYSIAEGIAFGFIIYSILMIAKGKFKDMSKIMFWLSVFFLLYYFVTTLSEHGIIF